MMKQRIHVGLASFFLFMLAAQCTFASGGSPSKKSIESISAEDARRHVTYLASDKLLGRNTPSPELIVAGDYIIEHFKSIGLKPVNGKYYHSWYFTRVNLGPIEKNKLAFAAPGKKTKAFEIKKDFIPFAESGSANVDAELVFLGYGIRDAEKKFDEYAGVNVKNKIVVIVQGEPLIDTAKAMRTPSSRRGWQAARFSSKIKNAVEAGALAAIVINDIYHGRPTAPRGTMWPQLNPTLPMTALPTFIPTRYDNKIPVINVGDEIINALFGSVQELKTLLKNIDSLRTPATKALKGKMQVDCAMQIEPQEIRNIVGLLPGDDPKLKDELVVIGGHYDHVGGKISTDSTDTIYNGADDNASGTTGVMEIAEAYTLNDAKPRRSMLFMAFAGEEKGLLGSKAYVDNPLFPVKQHVAMFNLDMIGRNSADTLSIGGNSRCPELAKINEEENQQIGFALQYNIESFFFRSDQASFAQEKIPVLFYFTGEHKDYHRVTDHADKINYEKLSRIARLCFLTSWRVANLDERLPFTDITR